ncbi:MAG: hypothetical protein ABIW84_00345 [Ilumatobacteraceae bacterium]
MASTKWNHLNNRALAYYGEGVAGAVTISTNASVDFRDPTTYTLNSGVTESGSGGFFVLLAKTSVSISGTINLSGASLGATGDHFGAWAATATGGAGAVLHNKILAYLSPGKHPLRIAGGHGAVGEAGILGGIPGRGGGGGGAFAAGGDGGTVSGTVAVVGTQGTKGTGGGVIFIVAPKVTLESTATLNVSGTAGGIGTSGSGGGGGGAGGSVVIITQQFLDKGATFNVSGGAGGANGSSAGGAGGGEQAAGSNGAAGVSGLGSGGGGGAGGSIFIYEVST